MISVKSTDTQSEIALLVGVGSIGKVHLDYLLKFFKKVLIFDISKEQLSRVKIIDSEKIEIIESLDKLRFQSLKLAVIATWGPSHFKIFNELVKSGCRKFIIEKPLCNSVAQLEEIKRLIKLNRIKLWVNTPYNYSEISKIFNRMSNVKKLGRLQSINVNGGAKCIATNGVHYLALSCMLFQSFPKSIIANLNNRKINPRSVDFDFLGGIAAWEFSKNRMLSISFNNFSHLNLSCLFNFQFGQAVLENDQLKIIYFDKEQKSLIGKPTDTKYPQKTLNTSKKFEGITKAGLDLFYNQVIYSQKDKFIFDYNVMLNLLLALFASKKKIKITNPMNRKLFNEFSNLTWKIS